MMQKFWAKVRKTNDCWWWTKTPNQSGYGRIFVKGRRYLAHRFAYESLVGTIPDGLHVLHKCDNRLCVNPDHLYLGTNADNVRDRIERGREWNRAGERNPNCVLSPEEVLRIRADDRTPSVVAKQYEICAATVKAIRARRLWKHL